MFLFTLDPLAVVQLIVAVVLPLVVGLVTTRVTKGSVKAWLLAALTLVSTILTGIAVALTNHVAFDLGVALLAAVPSFITSVAMYYGLWKPTGISAAAQNVEATAIVK